MRKGFLAVAFLAFCPLLVAQQSLNNDSVIKLVEVGLSDDLIVSTINASPGVFDASANALIALKGAGSSDKVVTAIVLKGNAPMAPVALPAQAVQSSVPQAPPPPLFHSTDGKIR